MPVRLGDKLKTLAIGVDMAFLKAFQSVTPPVFDQITRTVNMTTKTIEAPIAHMVGPLRVWTGAREVETVSWDRYSITAQKFEKTIDVDRDDVEADNIDIFMSSVETLGVQSRLLPDQRVGKKLEAGETDKCYDGKAFFASDHPVEHGDASSGTYANVAGSGGTAPWYLFNTSLPIKPMVWGLFKAPQIINRWNPDDPHVFDYDRYISGVRALGVADYGLPQLAYKHKGALDAANFDAAMAALDSRRNGKGESLGLSGTLLVVPTVLRATARKLFGQDRLASGESNIHKDAIRWVTWDRLANS